MMTADQISDRKRVLLLKDLKKSFGDNHVLNGFNLELFEVPSGKDFGSLQPSRSVDS